MKGLLRTASSKCRIFLFLVFITKFDQAISAVSLCRATLTGDSGTLTSPNYPLLPEQSSGDPNKNLNTCVWTIQVSPGKGIQLKFGDFNINGPLDDCGRGQVQIFSGTGKRKSHMDTYCVGNEPGTLMILKNTATVVFERPSSGLNGRGFLISYIAVARGETIADFVSCSEQGTNHSQVNFYSVTCPSGCGNLVGQIVFGKFPYREDSYICRAAIHAGVISDTVGGRFVVKREQGKAMYMKMKANNITGRFGSLGKYQFKFPSVEVCHEQIKLDLSQYSASSFLNETDKDDRRLRLWLPSKALLSSAVGAWSPSDPRKPHWLQISLRRKMNVTGIITRGSQDPYSFTKSFTVKYSVNNIVWHSYKEEGQAHAKLFGANENSFAEVRNNFVSPSIVARYVRIYPTPIGEDDFLPPGLKTSLIGCDLDNATPGDSVWYYSTTSTPKSTRSTSASTTTTTTTTTKSTTKRISVPNVQAKARTTDSSHQPLTNSTTADGNGNSNNGVGIRDPGTQGIGQNESGIIVIAIVAGLAVMAILLAALVLFLVRKKKKIPKHMTAIPGMSAQSNITYHTSVGMPYAPANNNTHRKKRKTNGKMRGSGENPPPNGMAIENSFAQGDATLPFDQLRHPLMNQVDVAYTTNGPTAQHHFAHYPVPERDQSSLTSDEDDHEYQVIADPVHDYSSHSLTHSSKASTGSSIGARSKGSNGSRRHPAAGRVMDSWSKEVPVEEHRQMTSFGMPTRVSIPQPHHQRVTSDHTVSLAPANGNEGRHFLSVGGRKNPPHRSSPSRSSFSPKRLSSSSNGSSTSSPNQFNPYFPPVSESQDHLSSNRHSELAAFTPHPQHQNGRHPSLKPQTDRDVYPSVFSPTANGHVVDRGPTNPPLFSNGSARQLGARQMDAGFSLSNRQQQRCDYDQLYRKKVSLDGSPSVVATATNNYDQLDLNATDS